MRHAYPASVTPAVLQWALERAEATRADVATSAGTSEAVVGGWFEGVRQPSFRQARAVANRLRIPFGFLFLTAPPPDELPIPDFRRVNGEPVSSVSVDLRDVLLATMRRQAWLAEQLQESGAQPVEVVGRARNEQSTSKVAADMRQALGLLNIAERPAGADNQLRDLVRRVEGLGVSVLRSGIVGNNTHRPLRVEDFRGFCLSDAYAPFIFINSVDAAQAQAFTLLHELTHIWRGDSGISGSIESSSLSIEVLCNRVAAEILVPADEFREVWDPDASLEDAVQLAARHFRVSRYVAAIRAYESGFIEQDTLNRLLDSFRSDGARRRTGDGGGDYYRTLIARNGRLFTEGVVDAVGRQRVLIRDAASLLEAKPGQLSRLAQELRGAGE